MSEESNTSPGSASTEASAPERAGVDGADAFFQLRALRKAYPGVIAVDDVDLEFRAGEVVGLVGKNGAGKSTLVKMLAGAVKPDRGGYFVDGKPVEIAKPQQASKLGLAVVHQEAIHVPNLSVAENIELGLGYPRRLGAFVNRGELRRRAREVLNRLDTDIDPDVRLAELSVVQQRLVMIAHGLAHEMRLLVLDEPTASLTDAEIEHLHRVVQSLAAEGVCVLYVSHRLDEIFEITDRVVVMRDARIVADTPTDRLTASQLISQITGHERVSGEGLGAEEPVSVPPKQPPRDEEILRVEGLTLPGVVEDVSFSLRSGEILGLGGLVGSGRTELVRLIFGADKHAAGRVFVHGEEVEISSPRDALAAGIVLLPEDRRSQGTVLEFSIRKNVTLATLPRHRLSRPLPVPMAGSERKTTRSLMERVQIRAPGEEQPVKLLSGGNQQKVVLAKWLERGADVLIFDEPTHGIDVEGKEEVYNLMHELAAEGRGIIFISSEFPELVPLCHRVLVIREGRLVAELDGEHVAEANIIKHCYAAEEAMGA